MSASTRNPPQRRRSLGPVSPKHIYRNLSVRLRGGEASVSGKTVAPRTKRKDTPAYKTLWEAVENEDTLSVQSLLSRDSAPGSLAAGGSGGGGGVGGMWERGEKKEKDWEREREKSVNRVSEQGLVPLDVAALTQNSPLLHVLTKAGARHNPVLCRPAEWSFKLDSLVALADKRVEERKKELVTHAGAGSQAQADAQRQLRLWTLRQQLYRRMRESFHQTGLPAPPSSVSLLVTSATSLFVSIRGPDSADTGLITRYRVEWSTSASFKRVLDSAQITDARSPSFNITGLETGVLYFVRASAYNVKGWGPPKNCSPDSAAPSSWTECVGVKAHSNQEALLSKLLEQTREPHYRGYCMESSKPQSPSKRLSVSRGLKQLFQSATKFVRLLQRGVYLATVFYHKDNILVTADDQLPLVEIQCCSTSITQDFLWFAKLSCAWQQVPWLQRALSSTLSSSSSLLQNRHNILRAVSQLQSSLGTLDLGQVYYEPLKDRHGNVLLVTLREFGTPPGPPDPPLHWVPLVRLEKNRCRTPLLPEPTAMDTLTEQLKDKMAYHRRSIQWAQPGLYVGILKLCSSVEQIRVLVPQKLPNLLCHTRVRHNPHVSREEWTWLQSHVFTNGTAQSLIGSDEDSQMDSSGLGDFVRSLRAAVTLLLTKLNIPLYRAYQYGVYTRELLQFGEKVSLLLLLPPSEDFSSSYWPLVGTKEPGLTMPLQIFELAHFWTYKRDFLSQYCQAWVRLELDAQLSQQALREALDTKEVLVARERQTHVTQLSQRLDVVWRETRWIMDVLQCVRSKQWVGAVPLGLVMGGDPPPGPDSEEEEQYLTARVWPQGTPVKTVEDTSVKPNIANILSSEILAPSSLQLATPEETVLLLVEGVAKGGYPVDVCAQSSLDLNSSGQSEFECGTGIIQSGMEPALVCQSDAGFADLSLPETLYEEEMFPPSLRSNVMQPLSELVEIIPALSVMEEHLPTDSASSLDAVDVFDNYGPGVSATNALFELENSKVDVIYGVDSEVASSSFLHGAQSPTHVKVPCDETNSMLSLGLGDRLCVTFLSYRDTAVSPVAAPAEKFDLPLEAVVTPVLHRGCCLPPVRNQVEWISSSKKT